MRDTPSPPSEEVEARIRDLVEQYRVGFAALDPGKLAAIWNRDHDGLVYVAQELAEPMYGWAAIEAYDERVATAFCRFLSVGELDGRSEPFVATGHATFVCHRTPDGWAVVHYHESKPP